MPAEEMHMHHYYTALGFRVQHTGAWAEGRELGVRSVAFREAVVSHIPMTETTTQVSDRIDVHGRHYVERRTMSVRNFDQANITMATRSKLVEWQRTVAHLDNGPIVPTEINGASEHVDDGMRVHAVVVLFPMLGPVTVFIDVDGNVHSVEGPNNMFTRPVVNRALSTARRLAKRDTVKMEDGMKGLEPEVSSFGTMGRCEIPGRVARTGKGVVMRSPEGDLPLPSGIKADVGDLLIAAAVSRGAGFEFESVRNVTRHDTWNMPDPTRTGTMRGVTAIPAALIVAGCAQALAMPFLHVGAAELLAYAFNRLFRNEEARDERA